MADDERLAGITAFVQAVDAGSFTRAAERLALTRSAVAKRIARLEGRLGARLFQRTTRRQSLTEAGQAYYERCRRALDELAAAEAALDAEGRAPHGRLRVSVPLLLGRHLVAPALTALARRHPALALELAFSDRVIDLLEDGFDLAVRVGSLRDSTTLAARPLGVQRYVYCAAPSWIAEHGRPQTPADLAGRTAIVYAGRGMPTAWEAPDADGRPVALPVQPRLRFDDVEAIADAALAGAGIARLPRWLIAGALHAGRLVEVLPDLAIPEAAVHAVWPRSRWLPARTRAAIDALVTELPARLGGA